jgi:hypothetical protein
VLLHLSDFWHLAERLSIDMVFLAAVIRQHASDWLVVPKLLL